MHPIYTTPGFIVESRPHGEAGKMLSIFTSDLGLIRATAQGIRFEKSKLRYHTQEYSFGLYSFVKGKEFWRITGGDELVFEGGHVSVEPAHQEFYARMALILRRLLHGEEAHPELFIILRSGADFLQNSSNMSSDQFKSFESLIVLRMLHVLGYIGKDSRLDGYFSIELVSLELVDKVAPQRMLMNQHINKALKESQL